MTVGGTKSRSSTAIPVPTTVVGGTASRSSAPNDVGPSSNQSIQSMSTVTGSPKGRHSHLQGGIANGSTIATGSPPPPPPPLPIPAESGTASPPPSFCGPAPAGFVLSADETAPSLEEPFWSFELP